MAVIRRSHNHKWARISTFWILYMVLGRVTHLVELAYSHPSTLPRAPSAQFPVHVQNLRTKKSCCFRRGASKEDVLLETCRGLLRLVTGGVLLVFDFQDAILASRCALELRAYGGCSNEKILYMGWPLGEATEKMLFKRFATQPATGKMHVGRWPCT